MAKIVLEGGQGTFMRGRLNQWLFMITKVSKIGLKSDYVI